MALPQNIPILGWTWDDLLFLILAGIVFFEALSMSRLFIGNSDLDVMLKAGDFARSRKPNRRSESRRMDPPESQGDTA